MGKSYLLIEGVNLGNSIYDTEHLSIIRGSSFLYKDAIEAIATTFHSKLKPISTGASIGLFAIVQTAEKVDDLAKEVVMHLNKDPDYRHLSILVEHCEADNILQAKQKLQTQLRWRQLGAFSQVPDKQDKGYALAMDTVSQLEGIRIAADGLVKTLQKEKRALSLSEYQRWLVGLNKKHSYYKGIAAESDLVFAEQLNSLGFATDIQVLCECERYRQLNGKMAVVYIDGNGFGARQNAYLKSAIEQGQDGIEAQQRFDDKIQRERADFLTECLRDFVQGKYQNGIGQNDQGESIIRLETLLWGGDEMLFILPAWLGFDFLQQFYSKAENWRLSDEKPLTHAAGIVFCKAKTPIRIIRDIAERLANRVKNKCSRERSAWDYLVLESVDYPTNTDLDEYFNQRYNQHVDLATTRRAGHFVSKGSWESLKPKVKQLLSLTTSHQVFRLTDQIQTQGSSGSYLWQDLSKLENSEKAAPLSVQEEQEQRLLAVMSTEENRQIFIRLAQEVAQGLFSLDIRESASDRAWFWLHLLELWNYLCPKTIQEEAA